MASRKVNRSYGRVSHEILEKYAGRYVAITNDGQRVLASAESGQEVVAEVDRQGVDRHDYFIKRIRTPNLPVVLRPRLLR